MIAHVISDEVEPTAKRHVCICCHRSAYAHEETEQGVICRKCVSDSTAIRLEYVINGKIYSKWLKRISVVKKEKK
jgi:hypothetical protein